MCPSHTPFDVTFFKEENNICVVQPDIVVICDENNIDEKGEYKGIPALVVEVLSPSSRNKDMLKKLESYKQCGVNEYWIVDPINEHILIYTLEKMRSQITNPIPKVPIKSFNPVYLQDWKQTCKMCLLDMDKRAWRL